MNLADAPAITITLHQLKRLVSNSVDVDDLSLDGVATRIWELATLHAELGCEECTETRRVLAGWAPHPHP